MQATVVSVDVGDVAALREQEPTLGLVEAPELLRQAVAGEPPVELVAVHHLVRRDPRQ